MVSSTISLLLVLLQFLCILILWGQSNPRLHTQLMGQSLVPEVVRQNGYFPLRVSGIAAQFIRVQFCILQTAMLIKAPAPDTWRFWEAWGCLRRFWTSCCQANYQTSNQLNAHIFPLCCIFSSWDKKKKEASNPFSCSFNLSEQTLTAGCLITGFWANLWSSESLSIPQPGRGDLHSLPNSEFSFECCPKEDRRH